MLSSTSTREAVLAGPQPPHWNLPSFTVESTLSFPCSCSDPPSSCQGAALAHLDSLPPYDLILWTNGSVPFPFGKGGSSVPANCFLALRPLFPFRHTQYAQVFPLKPSPFCTLFAGLGSTSKSATPLLLLSESRSVLFSIFPFTAISLTDLQELTSPPVLSGYNGSPNTRFSQGTTRLMSWPDEERYSCPL